jgi:hypothetical protein
MEFNAFAACAALAAIALAWLVSYSLPLDEIPKCDCEACKSAEGPHGL